MKGAAAVLAVVLMAFASACGKRGALEAPEGSVYPRSYPAPESLEPRDEAGTREEEEERR